MTPYYKRLLDLQSNLKNKSVFLLGPRQTGKSSLIKRQLPDLRVIDLLESETRLTLQHSPERLRQWLANEEGSTIVIDEIQLVPELLSEVHLLIEKQNLKFLLTGSSARKLKKGSFNLLGGRARVVNCFPLVSQELGKDFNLLKALSWGTIPSIVNSDNPKADLSSYLTTYLEDEISREALTRNIPAFSRFLQVAALSNAQIINYAKTASDCQVSSSTVQEYYQILRDTLVGEDLAVWQKGHKRKTSRTAKFYLFDIGVVRALCENRALEPQGTDFGQALESFIWQELRAYSSYKNLAKLYYWRTQAGTEVDFILDNQVAIEVKATRNVRKSDCKGLAALMEEGEKMKSIIVCQESKKRTLGSIECYPVEEFLKELWEGRIV